MIYRSDDGTEAEIIWNSRDGVTPFVISLQSGKPASHSYWSADIRVPDYKPPVGSRIFIDMTPGALKELYYKKYTKYWVGSPLLGYEDQSQEARQAREQWSGILAMILDLMQEWDEGNPNLIEVTEEWRQL